MWHKRSRYRCRLLPAGKVLVLAAILVLAAAWNSGANLLYVVVGGILSLLTLSWIGARWSLASLSVVRQPPEGVHREERFGVTVRIENAKLLMPALSLRLERRDRPGKALHFLPLIPARAAAILRMSEVFSRRGLHPLPPIDIVTRFPFGLMQGRCRVEDSREVLVYPRIVALRPFQLEQLSGSGRVPRALKGGGDEFFSLRDYISGDDIRRIAWRASARHGAWLVKELEFDTSRRVLFLLDTRLPEGLSQAEDRFEEVVEMVASLAVTLLHRQYQVAILTPSSALPLGEEKGQVLKVLQLLARVQPLAASEPVHFDTRLAGADQGPCAYAYVSPDPATWGQRTAFGGARTLDPREVIRA